MKLAWICYPHSYDDEDEDEETIPVLVTTEPHEYRYKKVIAIVYAELEN